ncbi:MAG: hypothetical protein AB1733_03575 [Thermodesulfobacteriota bacterium]
MKGKLDDKLTGRLAEETWEIRKKADELVNLSMTEDEALALATNFDPDRLSMLEQWKEHGLWPIGDQERQVRSESPCIFSGADGIPDFSLSNDALSKEGEISEEEKLSSGWMDYVLSAVRVTINAAIMDYHNGCVSELEKQVSTLENRVSRLESAGSESLSRTEVRRVVQELVKDALDEKEARGQKLQEPEQSPSPTVPFESPNAVADRAQLSVTCDRSLVELFEGDRMKRGLNADEMMDFILRTFYEGSGLVS